MTAAFVWKKERFQARFFAAFIFKNVYYLCYPSENFLEVMATGIIQNIPARGQLPICCLLPITAHCPAPSCSPGVPAFSLQLVWISHMTLFLPNYVL